MSMNELQKQTNANIQAKANLIWEIATHLVGLFKPHEYGKVILPMTVLKRFDDALMPTKAAVVEMAKKLDTQHVEGAARDGILCRVSGFDFYNTSNYDFAKLISDPDNVETNFEAYLRGFSSNVKDIIENFDFANTVKLMVKGGVLFVTLQEFNSTKADMSPEKITSADMGYIFEELIRKFSESYDEQAGAHFTSRDIIYLMAELLVAPEKAEITAEGCTKTAYGYIPDAGLSDRAPTGDQRGRHAHLLRAGVQPRDLRHCKGGYAHQGRQRIRHEIWRHTERRRVLWLRI